MNNILRSVPGTTFLVAAAYTVGVFALWALNLALGMGSLPAVRFPEAVAVVFAVVAHKLLARDMQLWQVITANVVALVVGYAVHHVVFTGNAVYQLAPQVLAVALAYWVALYVVTQALRTYATPKKAA